MMDVRMWGTRGSLPTAGPDTARYGGNTSCVQVVEEGWQLVLDAGTGIKRLGSSLPKDLKRVDVLLSHHHMDHIQGLGFFAPLYEPDCEVHIWGPASPTMSLRKRLSRYMSPPLFPVHLRDLPCKLFLHEQPGVFEVGPFTIASTLICHPGPTLGYRIRSRSGIVAYIPDHEPALGRHGEPWVRSDWTSGHSTAEGADLLVHDAQYTPDEYADREGWGHSTMEDAIAYAKFVGAKHLVPFHHDPDHSDAILEDRWSRLVRDLKPAIPVTPAQEGAVFTLGRPG
jgi:phosphoribosyl 1,2-cyclic phosphodiesterase